MIILYQVIISEFNYECIFYDIDDNGITIQSMSVSVFIEDEKLLIFNTNTRLSLFVFLSSALSRLLFKKSNSSRVSH